jgi:DNA-directed RNA polymerase subunit F
MAKSKQERLTEISGKFHEAYDLLDELASETEDSVSNQEGTNLENTECFQRLQEASATLSQCRDDIDSALSDLDSVEF